MRIDLPGVEAFLGVAHWASFRRAAAHMNLSQAALSHRIKKLEEALGTPLLSRTTRRVALTEAGIELLPVARRSVDDMSAALAGLRDRGRLEAERLAIGCLPTIALLALPSALAQFRRAHPAVRVQVFDNSAAEIVGRVRAGEADFGITVVSKLGLDLDITPLFKDPFVLVCPTGHPFARRSQVRWDDLERETLIRVSAETANRLLIDEALRDRREALQWAIEVQRVPTAIGMVRAGLGLTVLPRSGLDAAAAGGLVGVTLRSPTVVRQIGLIAVRGRPISALASAFSNLIGSQVSLQAAHRAARRHQDVGEPARRPAVTAGKV